MRLMRVAATAFTFALAVFATSGGASAKTKIVLAHSQQQLTPSFAIGSSLPAFLKFWDEEDLEVEVVTTPGAAAAIQLVIAGRADVALANPTSAMAAIQRGADVKVIYTATRGDIFGVALPAGVKLSDLKGKTVGVSNFASGSNPYARALLRQAGLEPDKDVNIVEIGTGGRAAAAFKSNQVQAVSLWDEQYTLLAEQGLTFATLIKDPRAKNFVAGSLVVKNEDIEKRRDLMVGLARGIAKAQAFQDVYPEEVVKIHWKVYPASAPRTMDDTAVKSAVRVLQSRKEIQSRDIFGTGRFGDIPFERFSDFQDYLVLVGELPKAGDVKQYLTNDLIADINKFDEKAVIAKALEMKP